MYRPIVAVKRNAQSPITLQEAISRCNGLDGLKRDDHVFIKPNLIGWDSQYPMPPFGIFTTSSLIEDMITVG
jgi:hypothetical protein